MKMIFVCIYYVYRVSNRANKLNIKIGWFFLVNPIFLERGIPFSCFFVILLYHIPWCVSFNIRQQVRTCTSSNYAITITQLSNAFRSSDPRRYFVPPTRLPDWSHGCTVQVLMLRYLSGTCTCTCTVGATALLYITW